MVNYVFDANIVTFLLKKDPITSQRLQHQLQPQDTLIGCPLVWFEIRRGLLEKNAPAQLKRLKHLFGLMQWQDFTRADWQLASDWWVQRRTVGRPIEDADLLIAVFAHNRNAVLVTDNEKDFDLLAVTIENWKRP